MKIDRINGALFEVMVKGGYYNLCNHEKEINNMNIFPVPDGDTGYNMRMTLENGIKHAKSDTHLGNYLKGLSHGMLLGARGNSGVILSQLFHGMAIELERKSVVDAGELRNTLISAYKTAYSAVVHPVEGTILTVAREGIENIRSQVGRGTTADMVMSMYLAEMRKAVKHTPEILNVLKDAGVLDSGAVGYITIVDGMVRTMYGENSALTEDAEGLTSTNAEAPAVFNRNSSFEFGYCTEFLLQLLETKEAAASFSLNAFKDTLASMGTSLVVIQSDDIVKVHIHTFRPEQVVAVARHYGEFISFKLENMQIQHTEFESRKKETAAQTSVSGLFAVADTKEKHEHKDISIIEVADGSGITEIMKGCGADIVLSGGQTLNPPAEDFMTAYKSLDADKIVVFPNNTNVEQTAIQAADVVEMKDKVVIIPTKSVMEGYYAIALGSPDIEDVNDRIAAMRDGAGSILTVSVTQAVKDYSGQDLTCRKGDYLGFVGKNIVSAEKDLYSALGKALRSIEDLREKSTFVVLKGNKLGTDEEKMLSETLESEFADFEVELLYGGQKIYDVIVGVI